MQQNNQGSASGSELPRMEFDADFKVLLALLCLVCAVDGGDSILLPATSHALEQDLKLTPIDLSHMSFAQAISLAIFAPFWGILADWAIFSRRVLLAIGCVGWGLLTCLQAGASGAQQMFFLRVVNGIMLACLGPIVAGLVADVTPEMYRGRVYSLTFSSIRVGVMIAGLFATCVASQTVFGMQGWRFAFRVVGIISCAVGALIAVKMPEPHRHARQPRIVDAGFEGRRKNLSADLKQFTQYFRVPTVILMTLQGVFGAVPWNALGFATMYLQVQGLSDAQASGIFAIFQATSIAGMLFGGIIADALAVRFPQHGRVLTAEFSVAAGIPISFLIFGIFPPSTVSFLFYAMLFACLGLLATWFLSAALPLLSELVAVESRSTVLALIQAVSGTSAAIFGAPTVGYLAESLFGYHLNATSKVKQTDAELNAANARALANSLLIAVVGPWCVCLLIISLMHWSYPRDMKRLKAVECLSFGTVGTVQLRDFSSPGDVGASDMHARARQG